MKFSETLVKIMWPTLHFNLQKKFPWTPASSTKTVVPKFNKNFHYLQVLANTP